MIPNPSFPQDFQNGQQRPKSTSSGSTYHWRIRHRDGRILAGYSKMEGRKEKPDNKTEIELLIDKINMLYRYDYLFKLSNRIDFFVMTSNTVKEAVHFLSLYETGHWFVQPEILNNPMWTPVVKHVEGLYQSADQVSYPDVKTFFTASKVERQTFFKATGKELQQEFFKRFDDPRYTVDWILSNPKWWKANKSNELDRDYFIPFLNYLIKRGAEPQAINHYVREVAEINPLLELSPLPMPRY